MKQKEFEKLLKEADKQEAINEHISVSLCFGTSFNGLRWCVVKTEACKVPKWQFWRVRYTHCRMYGPFPSRNQAVKFANYLANEV